MFAGFNIKEDYLSDEDQNSSNNVNNKTNESLVDEDDKSPEESSKRNVVVINNNLSAQEDEDSFILITNSNTTSQENQQDQKLDTNIVTEELPTQEIIESNQDITEFVNTESVVETTSTPHEEIEFHTMDQSDQNEQSFENMERSFMAHSTSVTSQTREPLSILTSEDIDTDESSASSSSSSPVLLIGEEIVETVDETTHQVFDESSASTNSMVETILGSVLSQETPNDTVVNLLTTSDITNCTINEIGLTNLLLAQIDPRNPRFNLLLQTGVIACIYLFLLSVIEIVCN